MTAMLKNFSFLLFVILITGCSASKKSIKATQNTSTTTRAQGVMNESFNPMSLNDYDFEVNTKNNTPEIDMGLVAREGSDSSSSGTVEMVDGYRVQIISTVDENTAREMLKEVILKQDQDVYLTFDNPYYKVRVGNCLTRSEADDFQEQLVKMGFLDAWVIRTKVFKNEALKQIR